MEKSKGASAACWRNARGSQKYFSVLGDGVGGAAVVVGGSKNPKILNCLSVLSGEGDAGRGDGAERAGGAGVVPEPESQGENKQQQRRRQQRLKQAALLHQAANKSARRRVLKLIAAFL